MSVYKKNEILMRRRDKIECIILHTWVGEERTFVG